MSLTLDPQWEPMVQQQVFKQVLLAISYVGEIYNLPEEINPDQTVIAVLGALCDESCIYSDPHGLIQKSDEPFLGGHPVAPDNAQFVMADSRQAPNLSVKTGNIYRPEDSATVILRVSKWGPGVDQWFLSGPGISDIMTIETNQDLSNWVRWRNSVVKYPCGVDLIICGQGKVMGLPRTTVAYKKDMS